MPIPMVIISLYPKHIQVGEERMQVREIILLDRISYKLLSADPKYLVGVIKS